MILQLRPSSTISAIWPKVMHGRQQVTKPALLITSYNHVRNQLKI